MRGELSSQQSQSLVFTVISIRQTIRTFNHGVVVPLSQFWWQEQEQGPQQRCVLRSQNLFDDIGKVCDLIAIHITAPIAAADASDAEC